MALNLLDAPTKIKTKSNVLVENVAQLLITLFALHIVNNIILDVWRSVRGH
jgi:hypothetical protein